MVWGGQGIGGQGCPLWGGGRCQRKLCRAGALGRPGPLRWPQPGPIPSQVHGERVIWSTRKVRFSAVGRTWPPTGSWFQLVLLLFHASSPSSRLPPEGPALLQPLAAPARKGHWFLLEEEAVPPSGCKGGETEGGSERARDVLEVTQPERQGGLGAWSWDEGNGGDRARAAELGLPGGR